MATGQATLVEAEQRERDAGEPNSGPERGSPHAAATYVPEARHVLERLFGPVGQRDFAVRFWDGTADTPPRAAARFTVVFREPESVRRMFLPLSELRLAEAFIRGDVDVEGDLESAATLGDTVRARIGSARAVAGVTRALLRLPGGAARRTQGRLAGGARLRPRHSRERDAQAVRSHYDLGNDFYALWLDREMLYSCAYFETGSEDIDAAQQAKLDLICRKLRLKPGERLLDIGCGWGALIRYAARRYGVTALGITLSRAQAALARKRIDEDGLGDRCTVELRDYRDMPEDRRFDKIVSVGMFEHVGPQQMLRYFSKALTLLDPGGLFLNHGIVTRNRTWREGARGWFERAVWGRGKFLDRYVFPDGELVTLDFTLRCAEEAGFETRDVESLREHYALTLRHWRRRLEAAAARATALAGSETYRVWRLYLAASAYGFASARTGIVQSLLARPAADGRVSLPLTRADLYAGR